MKQLSPYEVMQAEVNRIAQAVTDPATADFGQFFLGATAALATYGDQNQAMNATLCAYALRSLDEEARAAFIDAVELPGRVYQELSSPSDWPVSTPQDPTID